MLFLLLLSTREKLLFVFVFSLFNLRRENRSKRKKNGGGKDAKGDRGSHGTRIREEEEEGRSHQKRQAKESGTTGGARGAREVAGKQGSWVGGSDLWIALTVMFTFMWWGADEERLLGVPPNLVEFLHRATVEVGRENGWQLGGAGPGGGIGVGGRDVHFYQEKEAGEGGGEEKKDDVKYFFSLLFSRSFLPSLFFFPFLGNNPHKVCWKVLECSMKGL